MPFTQAPWASHCDSTRCATYSGFAPHTTLSYGMWRIHVFNQPRWLHTIMGRISHSPHNAWLYPSRYIFGRFCTPMREHKRWPVQRETPPGRHTRT